MDFNELMENVKKENGEAPRPLELSSGANLETATMEHIPRFRALPFASLLVGTILLMTCVSALPARAEPAAPGKPAVQTDPVAAGVKAVNGKILMVSEIAKTISLQVGEAVEMVRYTDQTTGMENAVPDHAVIVEYETRGKEKVVVRITPKLAQAPSGASTMSPVELAALIGAGQGKTSYFLADARPASQYEEGHIPTAISLPVPKLEQAGVTLLPKEKNGLLIFYCGGPT